MHLHKLIGWYQKNINRYDKDKWNESEKHTIINGKPKADLIDVDLVRGSAFSKSKPKKNVFSVIMSATLRLLFLPFYSEWWVHETSCRIYKYLLTLYVVQIVNWIIFIYITMSLQEHIVSMRDLVLPNFLSFLLTFIHSQIAATGNSQTKFSLPTSRKKSQRYTKRIKNKSVPYNSKRTNMLSAHNFVDQIYQDEQARDSVSYIHRNNLSNCPTGLRNRNSNWNHLFSPYWMSRKEVEKPISESGSVGSEQSNTDHGFESLNGKSSSSEEQLSKLSTQNEKDFNFGENNEMPTKNEMESDAEEHQISSHLNRQSSKVYSSPWLGVTSNSECSYSSGSESDSIVDESEYNSNSCTPKTVAIADKITCTIWQHNEMKKAEMSLQDISSVITNKVESMTDSSNYMYIGLSLSVLLACVPIFSRLCEIALSPATNKFNPTILLENASLSRSTIIKATFGETFWEFLLLTISLLSRFCLTFMWFFMLAVAERTFKQRLLYAKLFSHLTSSRRAKKSEVPHFRLSKLRNIKLWLSIRSFLKKRGPQRSVDVIVSVTLILSIVLVSFLCAESLNDSVQQHWQYNLEVFVWSCSLGCFILRFMTLGTATNAKYRSVSILITEQINLYLKMEQNPEKKQKFSSANNVLKLAADLLKEVESPFKISGFNINPYLSAAIRVVVVSAMSGVCSEMLGFKIKLFKLKEPKNI